MPRLGGLGRADERTRRRGEEAPQGDEGEALSAQRAIGTRSGFWIALAASLALRAWFSAVLPVTADEAYFALWGRHPAIGYYDHPPMIGWLLAMILPFSAAAWALRLPALLLPALLALAVRAAARRWLGCDAQTADLAGIAVLLIPMFAWGVLVTTDTPLALFSVLSLLVFVRAAGRDSRGLFLLAGALLGAAFLSKYIAVLLGVAYLVWGALQRRWQGVLLVLLGALPAGLLNLWWNLNACWSNVMFNAINRHGDAGLSLETPLLFLLACAYLAAPLAWYLWRDRARLLPACADPAVRALVLAWVIPVLVFALLAPFRRIGLHWLLGFVPALVLTLAVVSGRRALSVTAAVFAGMFAAQALVLGALVLAPLDAWRGTGIHARLVFVSRTAEVLAAAAPLIAGHHLASDRYSSAAVLSYHAGRDVFVFGSGSSHARHDDILADLRLLDGRDIAVLRREDAPLPDYTSFFWSVETRRFDVRGATFHVMLGKRFDYAEYRDRVLAQVRDRYYAIPAWLPVRACYFCERHFGGVACSA